MKMTPLEHGGVISIRIEETRVITGAFCSAKTSQHQSPKQSYLLNRSASKERFNCTVST